MSERSTDEQASMPAGSVEKAQSRRAFEYFVAVVGGLVPVFAAPEGLWFVPSLAMAWYLTRGLGPAKAHGLTFEFADSFYYLGFTLSIGSLLASLHPFNPGTEINARQELRYFGLGMLSTLVGVVGRTVLQLYFRTVGESVADTNRQIQEVAHAFLAQLRDASAQVGNVIIEAASAARGATEAASQITAGLRDSQAALTALVGSAAEAASAADKVTKDAEQAGVDFRRAKRDADECAQSLGSLALTVSAAASGLGGDLAALRAALQQAGPALAEGVKVLSGAVKEVADEVGPVGHGLTEAIGGVTAELVRVDQDLGRIRFDPAPIEAGLAAAGASIENSAAELGGALSRLRAQLGETEGLFVEVGSSVRVAGLAQLGDRIGEFERLIGAVTEQLGELARVGLSSVPQLRGALNELVDEVVSLNRVLDDIADAATTRLDRFRASS